MGGDTGQDENIGIILWCNLWIWYVKLYFCYLEHFRSWWLLCLSELSGIVTNHNGENIIGSHYDRLRNLKGYAFVKMNCLLDTKQMTTINAQPVNLPSVQTAMMQFGDSWHRSNSNKELLTEIVTERLTFSYVLLLLSNARTYIDFLILQCFIVCKQCTLWKTVVTTTGDFKFSLSSSKNRSI